MSDRTTATLADLTGLDAQFFPLAAVSGESPSPGPWTRTDVLTDAPPWRSIAADYAAGLGTRGPVVGGSCALQGYAGKICALAVGWWSRTGCVADLDHDRLWVELREGRTVAVAADLAALPTDGPPEPVERLAARVVEHLAPIVTASRATSRITPRVAWGNVGAAGAGVFRRLHGHAPDEDRAGLAAAAERFIAAPAWPEGSLITWSPQPVGHDTTLRYRRSTCCLMRLAPDKAECASCSDLSIAEQAARWARVDS